MELTCTCGRYEQYGLLCRHIFLVLKLCKVNVFPKKYVMRRWTRDAVPRKSSTSSHGDAQSSESVEGVNNVARDIMFGTEYIVGKLSNNMEKLAIYREKVRGHMAEVDELCGVTQPIPKKDRIANLLGFNQPEKDTFRPPSGIRTKGCGSRKRFKSVQEQVATKPRKKSACGICGSTEHNRRTCTVGKEAAKSSDAI